MAMSRANHTLIDFNPTFDLKGAIDSWLEDARSLADWPVLHQDKLQSAAELVYIHHFGFDGVPPVGEFLNCGLDTALDYFLGPKRDEDRRDEVWYQPLRDGLMLGMLSARWEDVARFCSWVRADLMAEYCGPIDSRIPQLYVLIAGSLRGEPLEGSDELEASIAKSRTKRPRTLLKAWRAARDGDQAGFNSAMRLSLASFATKPPLPANDTYIGERIARAETAVCLAAMRLGLRFPEISDELAARVVTRKSLRLEE